MEGLAEAPDRELAMGAMPQPWQADSTMNAKLVCSVIATVFLLGTTCVARAQIAQVGCMEAEQIAIPSTYRYRIGDDPAWADSDFDARAFERGQTGALPQAMSGEIGWIRMVIEVDTTLWNVPMGLTAHIYGAADLYLDGELLHRFGEVGRSREAERAVGGAFGPRAFAFRPTTRQAAGVSRHVLAARYSSFFADTPAWEGFRPHFGIEIGCLDGMIDDRADHLRASTFHRIFLATSFVVLGIVHGLLFAFYPSLRANLYAAAAGFSAALFAYFNLRDWSIAPGSVSAGLWTNRLSALAGILTFVSMLRLTHWVIYPKRPRGFVILLVLIGGVTAWNWYRPFTFPASVSLVGLLVCVEILRAIAAARFHKRPIPLRGSWIMLVGILPVTLASVHGFAAHDLGIIPSLWESGVLPVPYYAGVLFMISVSVFLAYNFAGLNKDLATQLSQVRALTQQTIQQNAVRARLQAENDRKARELEDARRLQLSMLPAHVPTHPDFEFGVYSGTAVEVGGDYYDFWVDADVLTAALGDATGHGLQAGTIVTATKSLLNALSAEADPSSALHSASRALRQMNFRKVFMAMILIKLADRRARIAAAGTPRPLLYRAALHRVETLDLVGLPLGAPAEICPASATIEMRPGDMLLLMTDGLPELRNPEGELLGFDRIPHLFEAAAGGTAQEVVDRLIRNAEAWAAGHPRDDDITLLCVRALRHPEQ